MLKITHLHKTFFPNTPNEKKALRGVNLTLEEGDFVTVIGSNGSGKSTLAQELSQNMKPMFCILMPCSFCRLEIRSDEEEKRITDEFLDRHDSGSSTVIIPSCFMSVVWRKPIL